MGRERMGKREYGEEGDGEEGDGKEGDGEEGMVKMRCTIYLKCHMRNIDVLQSTAITPPPTHTHTLPPLLKKKRLVFKQVCLHVHFCVPVSTLQERNGTPAKQKC